jgi:predicted ATP-dependent Lon-type protease
MEISLESLIKIWGPLGLFVGVLLILIWKKLLPDIEKQHQENRFILTAALEDARRERDLMRSLREKEVERFLESLKYRDEQFKSVAEAISSVKRTR